MTPVVHVTNHAVERLFQRHRQDTAGMSVDAGRELIRREVADGITSHRKACRQPRWTCGYTLEPRRRAGAGKRYVWTEAEDRCYVVCREAGEWVVVSTYGRRAAA